MTEAVATPRVATARGATPRGATPRGATPRVVARADAARALLGHHLRRAPLADVVERLGTVQAAALPGLLEGAPPVDHAVARVLAPLDARLTGDCLDVHGWWWEAGVDGRTPKVAAALESGLARFLAYLGASSVALPTGLDRAIRSFWSAAVRGVSMSAPAATGARA